MSASVRNPYKPQTVETVLKKELGFESVEAFGSGVSGGCICETQGYETEQGRIFAKFSPRSMKHEEADTMFQGEFTSLATIASTRTLRVPTPLKLCRDSSSCPFFVMEYLDMSTLHQPAILGTQIAALHNHNKSVQNRTCGTVASSVHQSDRTGELVYVEKFGFDVPTCCGSTRQPNTWEQSWPDFYTRHRLKIQVDLIMEKYGDREVKELWPRLVRNIPGYFKDCGSIVPALLHGDLWYGNVGQVGEEPVAFDACSCYGHSEFDLALLMMFGGIREEFFDSYFALCPKAAGFETRNKLYQLFHYMNHWNIFGGSYKNQSLELLRQLSY